MNAESPPVNGQNRFAHIDAMRAFAVLLVVVAHAGLGHIVPGGSGVTIFFAISGFIITFLLLRERDNTGTFSVAGFYLRRVIKIAPPYITVILAPTLLYSLWAAVDWVGVLAQTFFAYNWIKTQGLAVLPGSEVVWSLAIEEQFYIVFAAIWLLTIKSAYWRSITVISACAGILFSTGLRLFLASSSTQSDRIYYGTDTRLDGIAWGVLAAVILHYWQSDRQTHRRLVTALSKDWMLCGAILIYLLSLVIRDEWYRDTFRFTFQAVASSLVILYGMLPGEGVIRKVFNSVVQSRILNLIGAASYSIYLVHLILNGIIRDEMTGMPLAFSVTTLSLVGIMAGIVIYYLIEIPTHRFGKKLRASPQTPVARRT